MGPEATIDLFSKIVKTTPAQCDQEHLRVIIDCNPKIPDRLKAIFERGENPGPALVATAKNLVQAGAQLLLIPCNAAHYYHGEIVQSVSIPVLHMLEETAAYCQRRLPEVRVFGLMAATSTIELGLYSRAFEGIQKKILVPPPKEQEKVMRCIYEIKAGRLGISVKNELLRVAADLSAEGAQAIILGCTEIPLVLRDGDLKIPFIDPTQVLAEKAVALARGYCTGVSPKNPENVDPSLNGSPAAIDSPR